MAAIATPKPRTTQRTRVGRSVVVFPGAVSLDIVMGLAGGGPARTTERNQDTGPHVDLNPPRRGGQMRGTPPADRPRSDDRRGPARDRPSPGETRARAGVGLRPSPAPTGRSP